jgi:hypothetical protein
MSNELLAAIIAAAGGLTGGLIGTSLSFWVERSKQKIERAKFISDLNTTSELERQRIEAYVNLWSCFDGLSTKHPQDMAINLPNAQEKLQDWYYRHGGGLILAGTYHQGDGSTKAAFFAARDLKSSEPSEIWQVFHELRRCLRRDLKIYDDDKEEARALNRIKEQLKQWGTN